MSDYNYEELIDALGIKGRKSGEQIIAKCPMHSDNNPSFSINTKRGAWTCFSQCGAGGFVMLVTKVLGVTIAGAHDWMMHTSTRLPIEENPLGPSPINSTPKWLVQFRMASNDKMPTWFFDRGFTWETVNNWNIKYDEDRKQILIPFDDIGLIARNLVSGPKYQNSPGLERSKYLFGWAQAVNPLILYLCEGPLDALWLWQHGHQAVALLGTNMSDEHINLIRDVPSICLALDSDAAGQAAMSKIAERLVAGHRPYGSVTRLRLPEGRKDVQNLTAQELEQVINNREVV